MTFFFYKWHQNQSFEAKQVQFWIFRAAESVATCKSHFRVTKMFMQSLCEHTAVSNYQASKCKLLAASIRGWDPWEGWQSEAERRVLS